MTAFSQLKHIMPNLKVQSYGSAFICQNVISYGPNKFEVLYQKSIDIHINIAILCLCRIKLEEKLEIQGHNEIQ